jgi:hypothetical protein
LLYLLGEFGHPFHGNGRHNHICRSQHILEGLIAST